jgi:hypothetical protein
MSGVISKALSALLKESSVAADLARRVAGAVRFRPRRCERSWNVITGDGCFRWQVEFKDEQQMLDFENALSEMLDWAEQGDE